MGVFVGSGCPVGISWASAGKGLVKLWDWCYTEDYRFNLQINWQLFYIIFVRKGCPKTDASTGDRNWYFCCRVSFFVASSPGQDEIKESVTSCYQ